MSLQPDILALWPELDWIEADALRAATARAWELALGRSPLKAADLHLIPFTLLHPTSVSFMAHKRCVVHIARESARAMQAFMGDELAICLDTVVAGAILADVGKLLEYEPDPAGKARQSARGKFLRHPFTGVALCLEAGVPDAVSHVVATHAAEGNFVTRSVEATIVHHADFMSYDPVAKRLQV